MSTLYHPRLSVDIILAMIPLLDQPTALVVSSVNRELRAHVPFLLLQKPVRLWSDRGIVSFNAFIRENGSFIPPCTQVHDLDITLSSSFPSEHVQRLKDTLDALTGLRSLTVRNLEVVLSQSFSFRRVLEGIKRLEVFSIETVGPTTVKFLRASRAKFQSIRVLDPIWRFPADALAGFECEDLVAYDCQVPPAPTPSHYSFVLPELSRLHIPRFFLESGVGHRAGFMYLAPNLSVLDVGTEYSARPWTDELLAHRRDNKAATVHFQIAVAEHRRQPVWTQLDVVRGGLVDLLIFGNTCRADVLELVGAPIADPALQWFIPQVVLDNEPRILRFSLSGPEFEMGGFVAQPVCLASVESLHVKVVLTSEAEWTACEYALAELTHSFGECKVLCLELDGVDAAVRDFLAEKDREQLALLIAALTQQVQATCVSTPLGPAYWRVGGTPGEVRELEEPQLSNEEGRRLLTGWGMFSEAYPLCDPASE